VSVVDLTDPYGIRKRWRTSQLVSLNTRKSQKTEIVGRLYKAFIPDCIASYSLVGLQFGLQFSEVRPRQSNLRKAPVAT